MKFIKSLNSDVGMHMMASRISSELNKGRKVLWLICGGSNIPTAIQAMNIIREVVHADKLSFLTIAQTDERYGAAGHPDSNWKQMQDGGFNMKGIKAIPILANKSLSETVTDYEKVRVPVMNDTLSAGGIIVGQFGMGEDGHIAGIQPHTLAVKDTHAVSGYQGTPFVRVTLTFSMLEKINVAYAFVFGKSKAHAVKALRDQNLSLNDEPAQILKKLPEVYFYSDLV